MMSGEEPSDEVGLSVNSGVRKADGLARKDRKAKGPRPTLQPQKFVLHGQPISRWTRSRDLMNRVHCELVQRFIGTLPLLFRKRELHWSGNCLGCRVGRGPLPCPGVW